MYYSPSTRGFYDDEFHGGPPTVDGQPNPDSGMPADVVGPFPAELHAELLAAQGKGLEIAPGPDGMPVARTPQEAPFADTVARALTQLRAERAPILSVLDGLQASCNAKAMTAYLASTPDLATAAAQSAMAAQIEALKQGLKDAPTAVTLAPGMTFEQMRKAFQAYYLSLVKGAPAAVVQAFQAVA